MSAPSVPPALRTQADRCPGLLRPHRAADGALVRIRLPGGRITAAALEATARAAVEFGDGQVQLTSRGNLQLRGVSTDDNGEAPAALVEMIAEAGLLPSWTHEMVRNITCSPLSGRSGGLADLREVVVELDDMICRTPALASLPGRFLFALDDGRGDVLTQAHDLGLQAVDATRAALTISGRPGRVVALRDAVPALRALALGFLRIRGDGPTAAWHVIELPDSGAALIDELPLDLPEHPVTVGSQPERQAGPSPIPDLGPLVQSDGRSLLTVSVPLGLLSRAQIAAVAAAATGSGSGELIISPWRTLLIPDLMLSAADLERLITDLANAGLVSDENSGWPGVSACTGAPGCAAAAAPTRPIAELLAGVSGRVGARPVHVVACERRCGSPALDHVEVLLLDGKHAVVTRHSAGSGPPQLTPEISERPASSTDLTNAVAFARNAL